MSGMFSTKQDAAAAGTLSYHMEPMLIFVSFRSISQAVSDDDRGAKSSRKDADGKKHMFILEHNLYQIPQRPLTIAITGRPARVQMAFGYFFSQRTSQSLRSCSLIEHVGLLKARNHDSFTKVDLAPDRKAWPQL